MWHSGRFEHQLDSKNRMRLPAFKREEYGDEFVISADLRGSLLVRQKEDMDKLSEKLSTVPMGDFERMDAIGWLYERSPCVKQDDQGRFVLPQILKDYAKIDKNVIIIGVPRGWTIWSEEGYAKRRTIYDEEDADTKYADYKRFDEVAELLKGYGV